MALNANKVPFANKANRVEQAPLDPGTYPARLVQIIDLGVQTKKPFQSQPKPPVHQIMLTYELLDEFCVDEKGEMLEDKPRWVSETIAFRSLKVDLAVSTKRYYALDPDEVHEGDFVKLIGTPCNVTIVNNESQGKIYNNVATVSAMRAKDAAKAPELVNPPKVFVLGEPDMEVFLSIPNWIQEKIQANLEFEGSALQKALKTHSGAAKEEPKATPKAAVKRAVEEPAEGPETDDQPEDDIPW